MGQDPNVVLRSQSLSAEISPLGAELRKLATADGRNLLWDGDPAFWAGRAPILFPIVGALRDGRYRLDGAEYAMEKHGFARRSTFAVVKADETAALFRLEATPETRAIYPFDFRLDLRFSLNDATLAMEATVSNLGWGVMPASFGFHPALRWPLPFGQPRAEHRLVFDRDEPAPIRRIDPAGLLTPKPLPTPVAGRVLTLNDDLFVDDALIFDGLASRKLSYGGASGPQIEITFENLPLLGVWTKPGAGFVCIEPWAGIADPEDAEGELSEKAQVFAIEAGESHRLRMTLALEER